jgi:hypothetical protein
VRSEHLRGPRVVPARPPIRTGRRLQRRPTAPQAWFACGLHSDTFLGSPAWRVTCTSDVIDPNLTNGNGDDVIGVSANAPRKFGRYGIIGKLTPIGAVEVDGPDNQQTIFVSVGPARRETAPINITTHR